MQPIHAHSSSAVDIQASPSRSLEPSPTRNSWGQEDPFYYPEDPWRSPRYGTRPADDTASSLAGPSSSAAVSLYGDDDGAHLTSREEDAVARRRRALRYITSPSPLKKMGTATKHVSQNLRRASVRVVNMASVGLERLADDDDHLPDLAQTLPIRGRTLGFLGPTNRLRLLCFNFLVYPWTESIILLLIIFNAILLTIQSSRSLTLNDAPTTVHGYFHAWEDYAVFVLSIVFTLEACARICVSGLFFDPDTTSSFALRKSLALPTGKKGLVGPTLPETIELPFRLSITQSAAQTRRNAPYLRHSWSRIDALAICAFWTSFALASLSLEQRASSHIRVFRALSTLRTARLLTITSGTTAILHSLKIAQPLLTSVAYFVLFAMLLFSIIGVQVFKGSLRRTCILEATLGEQPIVLDDQFCGGYVDPVFLNETGYINLAGVPSKDIKGYICPLGQRCRESGTNPLNGVESFDTIYFSALQVIIVASANGWSPLVYATIDSEHFVSCIFFIICVVVLNFWLINLFVAVITNTFSAIRAETRKSAFGATNLTPIAEHDDDGHAPSDGRPPPPRHVNPAALIVRHTRWLFVALALASLALQATRTPDITAHQEHVLFLTELGITIAFDVEILLRIAAAFPDWRAFFGFGARVNTGEKAQQRQDKDTKGAGQNWLDAALTVGASVIQVPAIQRSPVYPWFTIFQLMRFYRVILVVPRMKPLLLAVFGNMSGLTNMTLFLILVNFIAALISVQFLRGDLGADQTMNFGTLYNAFLAVYQVSSSENWTDVLYDTAGAEIPFGQGAITVLFISGWMLFANFIVLQMFIAVINENFDVAEEAKKGKQATNYWSEYHPREGWLRRLNPYRWIRASAIEIKVLPANLVLPMQKSLMQDYAVPRADAASIVDTPTGRTGGRAGHYSRKSLAVLQKLFAGDTKHDIPLTTIKHVRTEAGDPEEEETERHLELLAAVRNKQATTSEELTDMICERRAQLKADFIRDHPSYDKTFWIFSQKNILRRTCQKLVQPASGVRVFATPQSPILYPLFQVTLLLIVVGGIVLEAIANPVYRRNYFTEHGLVRGAWFDIAESAFGFVFLTEFLIKIVADGFLFTPNAYVRSIWNLLDFVIMVGLLANVTTGLIFVGGLSRLTRSLKALRALRLITLIDRMRTTFESLIISGTPRIIDAGILAILYMIPYAVWGLNVFNGKMNECNDRGVNGADTCTNEFTNNVYGDAFGFAAPRVWANPAPSTVFSFDSFLASLLILFEIVSLEGWVDVMGIATSITGQNRQPKTNAAQINAIFFLIYNLLGAVVILTLFVSIIIGNFSSKTGSAFLTAAQREWIDLQKLFRRQRPSKRPRTRPDWAVRAWCYDRAVSKNGWWSWMMTCVFILHIAVLMTQTFSTHKVIDEVRNNFFLGSTSVYVLDVLVRLFGLGWTSFCSNGWSMFDFVVSGGSFVMTLIFRFGTLGFATQQLQKLFLVFIAFKLVERMNSLNKLFKTAVASLPIIFSLLCLWFILFLFFGILFLEVFALTKWNSAETRTQNFSTMVSTLVMLTFFTTGEGWNQYMHDYAIEYPRCTNADQENSDCGSPGWAFTLFIAWNLLSMYIFVNMFTGVIAENFSYVFQTSGATKAITRAQMRSFKRVWAEFANPKTGHLERSRFVPFFGKLSGVFEARIYPAEFSIPNIQGACKPSNGSQYAWPGRIIDGIDLNKLEKILKNIDYAAIRKRRAVYIRLYHEATISANRDGHGISFTDMVFLLAHHKLIVDRDALVLKDLVLRTETNKMVTDLVNLDRVRSLLKAILHRRRFLRYKQQHLMPSEPATPITTSYISTAGYSTPGSPTPQHLFSSDVSLSSSTSRLQRPNRPMKFPPTFH